jgi:hypothetical protein
MQLSLSARRIIGSAAWLTALHVLLAYGLPEGVFIGLAALLGILYWRGGPFAAVTTTLALLLVTAGYWAALKITGFEDHIYYRPDEKYVRFDYQFNHRRYQPDIHLDADMPHGDMRAMTTVDVAEPRRIRFDTDRDGFRNSRNYHGQRLLLVGDSFIAGNSNSQEDLLVEQLRRDHGIDTYSLAYPGNLADYAAYVRGFRARYPQEPRLLLFLFEGNDFEESRGRPASAVARYGRRYYEMFSEFSTYRVTMSLYKRFTRSREIREASGIEIAELAGRKLAILREYLEVTRRATLPEPPGFERTLQSLQPAIERVYFIPTNYRVYHKHLRPGEALPNAQWEYLTRLCRKYQLRCSNLTEALIRESDALLRKGELTWWRDDTHWNGRGIAVAARVVAVDLKRAGR